MESKERLLQLKLRRDEFIQQYVKARIKWISMSVSPILETRKQQNPNQPVRNRYGGSQESLITLYERVDLRNVGVRD